VSCQAPEIGEAPAASSFQGEAGAKLRREDPGIHAVTSIVGATGQNSAPSQRFEVTEWTSALRRVAALLASPVDDEVAAVFG